jgi:hypothetical protein
MIYVLTPEINSLVHGWKAYAYEFQPLQLLVGKPFPDGRPEGMLGDLLAKNMDRKPGDTLEIQETSLTGASVYRGVSGHEAGVVVLMPPSFRPSPLNRKHGGVAA